MSLFTFTLPNGIRVVHQQVKRSDVAHCGLLVNAGSRDEGEDEQGLAHYIEHCLFKGTTRRKPYHILSGLDAVGGELNAYTTKENTILYASFQNKHFAKAVDLLADITFNATFLEKEIVKEKDVIIDEIHSYLDSPGEAIFDDFEEQVFAGHAIGRNILGTEASVQSLSREMILGFIKKHFRTDRIVFSSVGNFSVNRVKATLERFLTDHPQTTSNVERTPFSGYKASHKTVEGNFHQTHCLLGNVAYDANHKQRTALILLSNVLGGPAMNSRLNLRIREKYGYTYNLEASYVPYSDTGFFSVYYGTDARYSERTMSLILKELRLLREEPLSARQLSAAKQQLIGQIALGQESRVNTMLSIGKSCLLFDKVAPLSEVYERIQKITSEDLHEVAQDIFNESQLSSLTFAGKNGN